MAEESFSLRDERIENWLRDRQLLSMQSFEFVGQNLACFDW